MLQSIVLDHNDLTECLLNRKITIKPLKLKRKAYNLYSQDETTSQASIAC